MLWLANKYHYQYLCSKYEVCVNGHITDRPRHTYRLDLTHTRPITRGGSTTTADDYRTGHSERWSAHR